MSCAPAAARCAVRAWVRDADGEGRGRNGKPRTCKEMCTFYVPYEQIYGDAAIRYDMERR
jgi:hypothetical protein